MRGVASRQRDDGSVPGYRNGGWVDTAAVLQYSDIWYRLGDLERADAAFRYGCGLQDSDGGFYGSFGPGSRYYPDEKVSWPVKFFLDALAGKIRRSFDSAADHFPTDVAHDDGRLGLVVSAIKTAGPRRVLEIGCGRGRLLRALQDHRPDLELAGLDVSDRMLAWLPKGVTPVHGSMLNLPFPHASLEFAFSVEALEHAVNLTGSHRESGRVIAPGGTLLIIDKNQTNLGQMEIEEWEQWFDERRVTTLLHGAGFDTHLHRAIPYDDRNGRDKLFLGWVARKRG